MTCRLEIVDMKESCHVKLFDKKTDKLAACSDINIEEKGDRSKLAFYLESVVDSSRYYVLRVEDKKTKRVIYLGLGFRKRPDSSNFFESIQDFVRFRKRDFVAQRRQAEFDAMADTMPAPDETSSSKKKKKEKKEEDDVEIDFSAMKLDGPDAPSKKKKKKKKKKIKKEKADSKKAMIKRTMTIMMIGVILLILHRHHREYFYKSWGNMIGSCCFYNKAFTDNRIMVLSVVAHVCNTRQGKRVILSW